MGTDRDGQQQVNVNARAQAAVWLARLRGPERTAQVERGFRRWLRADPMHARAFELLTDRLEAVERLRGAPTPERWRRARPAARFAWPAIAAMAAALALVTIGVLAYFKYTGIDTAVGEQRTLALSDGTRIYLNTATRVRVDFDQQRRRVELVSGEALFEVAKQTRPFVVVAGDREITALGTAFLVEREARELSVTLIEGKVSVTPKGADTRQSVAERAILAPGERLTISAGTAPRLDRPALEKVTAWRQGQVALDDVPLSEAVIEMNRYSTARLVIERPEAFDLPVGGFFRMGDSASFARAVAATYGMHVIVRDDVITLAGTPQASSQEPNRDP